MSVLASQEEIKRLRKEFCSKKFRDSLPERCGTACVNCHDDSYVEYHHIVPLELGGTNEYSNIAPLCLTCHGHAHFAHFAKAVRNARLKKVSGRKRSCPDDYKEILHDYLFCKISTTECKERLGMNQKTRFGDVVWVSEYKESLGIESCRNNIDIIKANNNGAIMNGKEIGSIKFKCGESYTFIYWNGESIKLDANEYYQPDCRYKLHKVWAKRGGEVIKGNRGWVAALESLRAGD